MKKAAFHSDDNRKNNFFTRRTFLQGAALGIMTSLGTEKTVFSKEPDSVSLLPDEYSNNDSFMFKKSLNNLSSFSLTGNQAIFYVSGISEPLKIMLIADTHLFRDDERGEPFRQYSERMSKAYNQTLHWQTAQPTNPEAAFEETLNIAKEQQVDSLALLGDILSFPSEAARDWLLEKLDAAQIPFHYISGNHDWHYEGLPGSEKELRDEWTVKRLSPLYQGKSPLMYSVKSKGIRLVFIDDSTNEILPEQLQFFQKQLAQNDPTILLMHIPPYAPGRSLGFGLAHPNWNAQTDVNYKVERRPRWPESGHNETTFAFYREILAAPNLIGTFSGHVHFQTLDIVQGKPFVSVSTNSQAAFLSLLLLPSDVK